MEAAGDLVGAFVELTASVEHRHDDFEGALVLLLVHIDGDTASVVLHGDAVVLVDGDLDVGAESSECFVDGVIYGLIDEVVKALLADVADVHGRALAYGFQAFKDLDITGAIVRAVLDFFFH